MLKQVGRYASLNQNIHVTSDPTHVTLTMLRMLAVVFGCRGCFLSESQRPNYFNTRR